MNRYHEAQRIYRHREPFYGYGFLHKQEALMRLGAMHAHHRVLLHSTKHPASSL